MVSIKGLEKLNALRQQLLDAEAVAAGFANHAAREAHEARVKMRKAAARKGQRTKREKAHAAHPETLNIMARSVGHMDARSVAAFVERWMEHGPSAPLTEHEAAFLERAALEKEESKKRWLKNAEQLGA